MSKRINLVEIQKVTEKIVRKFQPERIILFGSWAWGNPVPDSDVDLFVVKETCDTRRLAREIDMALFPRPFPIDLIVYDPDQVARREEMGDFFIHEVLSRGTVLYAR